MKVDKIIRALVQLGNFLKKVNSKNDVSQNEDINSFNKHIYETQQKNKWFDQLNIRKALSSISNNLTEDNLYKWINKENITSAKTVKQVGVIMPGNIPLVGLHDFLCVILSGHKFLGKLSSEDNILLPAIVAILIDIEPEIKNFVEFTDEKIIKADAIIATGNNNSFRYFDYYYKNTPHIFRKNRNSIAILDGNENFDELENLADDVFLYYGLGCRNVSKIYIPLNYSIELLTNAFEKYKSVKNNSKFNDNYIYNKTFFNINNNKFIDTGFLLLLENSSISSPISVLHYEFYNNIDKINSVLEEDLVKIQCIISNNSYFPNHILFGKSQFPELWDYADNVNTLKFLSKL